MIEKVNLEQKLGLFDDICNPRMVGTINGTAVKLVKLTGEFLWHHHELEDELFFVVKGQLLMHLREANAERVIAVNPGEFVIVPHGVEHKPCSVEGCEIMLIEPASTLNTGNVVNERTRPTLESI